MMEITILVTTQSGFSRTILTPNPLLFLQKKITMDSLQLRLSVPL